LTGGARACRIAGWQASALAYGPGPGARIVQRILALSVAIWHNWQIGAPVTRSLIAFDHCAGHIPRSSTLGGATGFVLRGARCLAAEQQPGELVAGVEELVEGGGQVLVGYPQRLVLMPCIAGGLRGRLGGE